MTLQQYQQWVESRCYYPRQNGKLYCAIAMAGEVGEVCNEVKKEYRDCKSIDDLILDESGDILFYLAALAHEYGHTLQDILDYNVRKLTMREPTPLPQRDREVL